MDAALQRALAIDAAEKLAGGAILDCYWVSIAGVERFLKTGATKYGDAFAAEADGLRALLDAGVRAPRALATGISARKAYLLIEHLELTREGDFSALGRMLARLHRVTNARFGWHRDNYVGANPQENSWHDDWSTFWFERRLRPQLDLARRNGFNVGEVPAREILAGHRPAASLVHGDLWHGNAGFAQGEPVIFDPAVYYGDRECDLAMTELFGGFPDEFYAAYEADYPLESGYQERKHLYNLYHLLNHLNIFGGSYLAQVSATLGLLRSFLQ